MLKNGISGVLNVYEALDTSCYLGIPSLVGRKKKVGENMEMVQ